MQSWKLFAALPVSFMFCQHFLGCCTFPTDRIFPNSTWLDYSIHLKKIWVFFPCLYLTSFSQFPYSRFLGHPVVTHSLLCLTHPCNFVMRGWEAGQFPSFCFWWSCNTLGIWVVNLGMLPQPAVKVNAVPCQ